MKVTILGCGSSVGVPSVGCNCAVCCSVDSHNKRTRTSALISKGGYQVLIDASPDLRFQALRHNLSALDAVLFTHCHADHSSGISELQAFAPRADRDTKSIDVYSDFTTLTLLYASHAYMFIPSKPSAPWKKCHYLTAHPVSHNVEFSVAGFKVIPFKQHHGGVISNGFIFDRSVAYCTDVKSFPPASWELLRNMDTLILGCLRYQEVAAHAHVDLCIEWIKELKPKRAVLTHMSHDIDYCEVINYIRHIIPDQEVLAAYDGLELEV